MTPAVLPEHASVVVIGGGVMGCSTLYHLAREGVGDALLLERNQLTSGTTWHSAAQVRALRSTQNLTNLIRYSVSLYRSLEEETGQATGWINKGSVSIATTQDRLVHIRRQQALAGLFGVDVRSISPGEAAERWPLMRSDDVVGAAWSPDDGRVSPSDLCAALVKGARARGATIAEGTAVTGIVTAGGKVTGVETSRGLVRCDAVALCTGLWSRRVGAMAGVSVPVWPCEHFYLLTKPVAGIAGNLPTLSDHDGHLYIRDEAGGLLVGCFEPLGKAIDPERLGEDFAFSLLPEDWDHFEPLMRSALHRLPCLETAEVRMLLNGPESFTPDGAFLLGPSAETEGFHLGCGMNSVGVATGGGAGMALAHSIVHGHMPFDLHELDPRRFAPCMSSVPALSARVPEVLGDHYAIAYPHKQWRSARDLRHVPLHALWQRERARFGQVYGYERPLYFTRAGDTRDDRAPGATFSHPAWWHDVEREVETAHTAAALFDLSTFGKVEVKGADAELFLDRVCAGNLRRAPGRAVYTTLLNERGGVESDLVGLRVADDEYLLYTGTSALRRDLWWLRRALADERVTLADVTERFAVLGLAGPGAAAVIDAVAAPDVATALHALRPFRHTECELAGQWARVARISYSGEPGVEITCRAEVAVEVGEALLGAGARPGGAFALTSMRIEKRFLAYGHELDTGVTPLEAGLEFALDFSTPFTGRDALLRQREEGVCRRVVSLVLDDRDAVPLGSEPVLVDGRHVGKTSSAAFGHRVGRPVALALVEEPASEDGQVVTVDIAGAPFRATVVNGAAWP